MNKHVIFIISFFGGMGLGMIISRMLLSGMVRSGLTIFLITLVVIPLAAAVHQDWMNRRERI